MSNNLFPGYSLAMPAVDGLLVRLTNGDRLIFTLASDGTLRSIGVERADKTVVFVHRASGEIDQSMSVPHLFDQTVAGEDLERAIFDLVQLVGALCGLLWQHKIEYVDDRIVWEFLKYEPPGSRHPRTHHR